MLITLLSRLKSLRCVLLLLLKDLVLRHRNAVISSRHAHPTESSMEVHLSCLGVRIVYTQEPIKIFFFVRKIDIQGDSGAICITLGNDSMSDSKQCRLNMGPILNCYGVMGIF